MANTNTYITIDEFKRFNLEKRYNAVSTNGFYIAKRIYRGMEVFLYKVDDFYAEVWKRYMLTEIVWIEIVPENTLHKYIDTVDLTKLLKNS